MADSKPIKDKDLIQNDVFANTIKSGEDLVLVLKDIESETKDLVKVFKKVADSAGKNIVDSESLNKAKKSLNELGKVNKEFTKTQKQRIQLEEKLVEAKSENIQENERIKVQLTEQRKANKELAKDQLGLTNAYQKQSKRLNELRKDYKNLVIQEGKTTKESRKLLKEIKGLDKELKELDKSVGQNFREIGNYEKALESTKKQLVKIAAAAAVTAGAFKGVGASLEESEEGSEDLRKVSSALGSVWDQLKNTAASLALDVVDFTKAVVSGDKEITEIGSSFERTSKNTENYAEKVKAAAAAEVEATERTIEFEKAVRPLEKRLSVLNGLIGEQLILGGDSTRSFDQIVDAVVKGQDLQIERARILFDIANEELKIIRTRLEARQKAGLNNIALLDQEKEAVIKLQEARNELLFEQLDNQKILRETARDRFEQELDFAIDAFDSQKTVNERRILDEKASVDARRLLLEETVRLTNSSFQNQIKLVQEFTKQKVDLDSIALESDEAVIRQRLKNFTLDEITTTRILEIIRERKLAVQDLADAERDLNDVEQAAIDIKKDLAEQEEALANLTTESLAQLEKDREQNTIDSLRRRLDLAKEGSIEHLTLNQQLNDALLKQGADRLAKEKELADKAAAEAKARTQETISQVLQITSAIGTELNRRNSQRAADRDREIDENQTALERQRDLAAQGADNELAFRKEQGDKLALQKKEALEKEARQLEAIQLTEAYFNALNAILSKPDANPNTAPAEALGTVLLAKGVAKALVPYYEGTEDTGSTGAMSDEHGAITGYTHSNERVIKATDNKQMSGLSNSELTQLAVDYKSGMLVSKHMFNDAGASLMVATRENTGPDPMVHRYDKMILLMEEANKRPIPSLNIDKLNRLVETIDRGGVKHKITYERRHIGK